MSYVSEKMFEERRGGGYLKHGCLLWRGFWGGCW